MKIANVDTIGERELLKDPQYTRVDKNGRIHIGADLAGTEVLVLIMKPIPQDEIDFMVK
jgi:hypothetical protein